MTSSRTAAAMAMARAFTLVSITGSSSSSSAESPASLIAATVVERPKQFPMDAAKTAVGHQHDHIAITVLADNGGDDVVVVGNVLSPCAAGAQIGNQSIGIQPLRLRQRRTEHGRDDHLVGGAERGRERLLKDTPAR